MLIGFFMEDILRKLIAYPTITGDFAAANAAFDYIESFLSERGMHVKRFSDSGYPALVATIRPNYKTPTVMLAAHIDVVPGVDEQFELQKQDGKFYGRGVFDMKYAIANYMQLVDDLQDELENHDFGIMITSDEELGCIDGVNGTGSLVKRGYIPRVCVLPDCGKGWNLEVFAKGFWHFDLIAEGKTAHGSRPWEGDSASFKLLDALQEIKQLFLGQNTTTHTLNIGAIEGGEARNQVPALMSATLDIRIADEQSFAALKQQIEVIAAKHNVSIETQALVDPLRNDPKDPFINDFMKSVAVITGRAYSTYSALGGSDGRFFGEVGAPCVIICPDGGGAHSELEWLDEQGFYEFKDVLADYLHRVLSSDLSSSHDQSPSSLEAIASI